LLTPRSGTAPVTAETEKVAAGAVTGDAMIGIRHRHGVTGTLMLRACNAVHHREKP
jgi:hypothetical protein